MAVVDITEFDNMARSGAGGIIPTGRFPAPNQQVAIGGASAQSAVFSSATTLIRVHTDAICRIAIGVNPTASATTPRMAANTTEYFGVAPGQRMAVITST